MDTPQPTYTLTELANLTAESLGKRPSEYIAHHRTLRNWWAKGLLPAETLDGPSDSEPARFSLDTAYAIPFLCVLAEMGQDVRTLQQIYGAIRSFADAGEGELLPGTVVAAEAIANGKSEQWFFHLWKSSRGFAGQWTQSEDDPRGSVAKRIMDDHAAVTGSQVVRTIIAATPLLQSLLNSMGGEVAKLPPKDI